jgi:hypothetical protein
MIMPYHYMWLHILVVKEVINEHAMLARCMLDEKSM